MDSTESIFASHSYFFTSPQVVVSRCGCGETGNAYAGWNQSLQNSIQYASIESGHWCSHRLWSLGAYHEFTVYAATIYESSSL